MKNPHILCQILGHKYPNDERGQHGYCERCNGTVFHDVKPSWHEAFAYLEDKWYVRLYYWFDQLPCRLFGHDWEDDSYGGPDSGYMGVSCKRCGYSTGSQLY